jgi:hypothetical protein
MISKHFKLLQAEIDSNFKNRRCSKNCKQHHFTSDILQSSDQLLEWFEASHYLLNAKSLYVLETAKISAPNYHMCDMQLFKHARDFFLKLY